MIKVILLIFLGFNLAVSAQPNPAHNLVFDTLAKRWDEGMPLGNGILGALVWQKEDRLRLSLDRADLWDERQALDLNRFNFRWVREQVEKKQYDTVQQLGDAPYEDSVFPTKIPAGALEFEISSLGPVTKNVLDISRALNTITFESGAICNIYLHATREAGYFGFDHLANNDFHPRLILPAYHNGNAGMPANSVQGQGLQRLGYGQGLVAQTDTSILYHQPTWRNHYYEIYVKWRQVAPGHLIGGWTISVDQPVRGDNLLTGGPEPTGWDAHANWWANFWSKSSLSVPDIALEKQYYLEIYKLGCLARQSAPAITLQGIWTADNGSLPPWKGDFHNDLNTQLSYWPAYSSNHLEEASTFTSWLWGIKEENKKYTKRYFGVGGLNVPGVATLHGFPMGGWIQYSLSPTTGAWLSQHFYWQWKYSMDNKLLRERVYPYIHETAVFLDQITSLEKGKRRLPLSSSPEYNDNGINAWFSDWTNYDLALAKFLFGAAREVCDSLNKKEEAQKWAVDLSQLPAYATDHTGLVVAAGQDLDISHRHLSPYMAIYPLGLLKIGQPADRKLIESSLEHIRKKGTDEWCGYSFAWMACVYSITKHPDSAVKMLRIFASHFCSPNSFHLNGDQLGAVYSHFTYRPFTLEGNFAFAQGLLEMLLQSEMGFVEVFPAIPGSWKQVSFENLRAQGGFLVSATRENGVTTKIRISATQEGTLHLKIPFKSYGILHENWTINKKDQVLLIPMRKGESISLVDNSQ